MEGYRHELKHMINRMDIAQLQLRLKAVMQRDQAGDGTGKYRVRSLYFDDVYDTALMEKVSGVSRRSKFRIRIYNGDQSFIRLEKKVKVSELSKKEGAQLSMEQVKGLLNGDYEALRDESNPLALELYARMHTQGLRPRCIVEYEREAFVYKPGNVRVTIDSNLRGSDNTKAFFDKDFTGVPSASLAILEVKYDEFIPQLVLDLVSLGSRRAAAFSKYAVARLAY